MPLVEPVPDEPAAVAAVDGERALLVADYHAGYEAALRYERGIEVPSRADSRRERLLDLLELTDPDRLVVLGDLMHSIGDPGGAERGELEVLFESLPPIDVTVVKGNHDGAIESWLGGGEEGAEADAERVDAPGEADPGPASLTIVSGDGARAGDLGVCHGHSWPAPEVLRADVVCAGHEHPCVRLEDDVGGSRVEPAWLRGRLDLEWFAERPAYDGVDLIADAETSSDAAGASGADSSTEAGVPSETGQPSATGAPSLVVFPAFNDLVGGTWVNVAAQSFLSPFLPEGLADGEAYLLDGTRLGPYESV